MSAAAAATLLRTLAAAGAGGGVLHLLGVPSGMLVGAMAGTACLALAGQPTYRHRWAKPAAQILVGTGVGASLHRDSLGLVVGMLGPIALTIAVLVAVGVGLGLWMAAWTDTDVGTALTATMPGGMVEMVLVSEEVGADSAVVASVHLMRILAVMGTLPVVLGVLT